MGKITSLAGLSTVLYQFPEGESMADVAARAEKVVAHLAAAPAEVDGQASESPSNPDPIVGAPGSGLATCHQEEPPDPGYVPYRPEKGFLLVELDSMTLESHFAVPPLKPCISVPDEMCHYNGWHSVAKSISSAKLEELGWHLVHGRGDSGYMPGAVLTISVTILYQGRYLLPPPGVWPHDLPSKVERGEVIPDENWIDVYARRPDLLAFCADDFNDKLNDWCISQIQHHIVTFRLRRGPETTIWHVYRSRAGFETFFRRLLGDNFRWQTNRRPNREDGQPDHLKLVVHGFTAEMRDFIPQLFGKQQWLKKVILAAAFGVSPHYNYRQLHDGEMHLVP